MTGPLWDLVIFLAVIGVFWAVAMFDIWEEDKHE